MLKDYEEYLIRIRDNLIRCGVSLPVKRDYTYEELFNLGENISDILWFYKILAVVNSRARLMGFNWSLDRTLKGKLRSMFYDEYLEGKRSYDEISVEKFLEKKYGSQRPSEGYDESGDEDDQGDSGYELLERDVSASEHSESPELKSSGNLSAAGMLARFITQNNVNTPEEDEYDDLENFNGGDVGDTYSGVQFDENDFPSDEDEDDSEDAEGTFLDDEEEKELSEMDGTFLEDEEESEEGIPSFSEDDFPSEPEDEEDLSDGSWLSDEDEEDDSDNDGWFDGGESEVEFSEDDFPDESDDEDNEDEVEFSDEDFPDESDEDEEDEEDEDVEFSDDDFPGFGDIDEEDEEPTFKNVQSSSPSQGVGNPSATSRPVKRHMTQMEKDIKSVEDASRILSTGVSKSKNVLKGILKGMIPKN